MTTTIGLILIAILGVAHFIWFPEIIRMRQDLAALKDYFEIEGDPLDGKD